MLKNIQLIDDATFWNLASSGELRQDARYKHEVIPDFHPETWVEFLNLAGQRIQITNLTQTVLQTTF